MQDNFNLIFNFGTKFAYLILAQFLYMQTLCQRNLLTFKTFYDK